MAADKYRSIHLCAHSLFCPTCFTTVLAHHQHSSLQDSSTGQNDRGNVPEFMHVTSSSKPVHCKSRIKLTDEPVGPMSSSCMSQLFVHMATKI